MAKKKHLHHKKKIEIINEVPDFTANSTELKLFTWTKKSKLYLLMAVLATVLAYSGSLTNGLIPNWDDGGYIIEDTNVHDFNLGNIWTEFYKGNYHPLTTTFYAAEYALVKEHPFLYHLNNLIFHLLNVVLVFIFIMLITKGKEEVAFITSLFFGIHPMHVESVAWISERKDVLYTFFFMLSLLCYYFYAFRSKPVGKFLFYGLLLFGLSMLSKSAAVILPFILLLLDLYLKRTYELNRSQLSISTLINGICLIIVLISFWLNILDPATDASAKTNMFSMLLWYLTIGFSIFAFVLSFVYLKKQTLKSNFILTNIIEKAGYFEMALVFGIIAILSQGEAHAIQDLTPLFNVPERLMLASYAFMTYIQKMFLPIELMPMYAYPDRIAGHLPMVYRLAPIFILAVTLLIVFTWKKTKDVFFGVLWFLITIILVLQLLPVGGAILSERYTYVPYIGLFFILGKLFDWAISKQIQLKPVLNFFLALTAVACSYLTFERVKDWKAGDVLFIDLAMKNPQLPFAYNNLGYYYYKWGKENDKAIYYFNKCLSLEPKNENALTNRGVLFFNQGKFNEAYNDFSKALEQRKDKGDSWIGRANTLSTLQRFREAIYDYNRYMKIKKNDTNAYLWRGIAYFRVGQYDSSITDLNYFLKLKQRNDEGYYFRGFDFFNKSKYQEAINDFETALSISAKRTDLYNYIGLAKHSQKKYKEAIDNYNKAIQFNPKNAEIYVNRSRSLYELHMYDQALKDMQTAGDMRLPLDKNYYLTLVRLTGKY